MNISHILTFFRIVISPVFIAVYLYYDSFGIAFESLPYVLFVMLILAELTDALDGYFARKFHQVTDVGKIIDPMADSLYHASVFLAFTRPPISLPIFILFIFMLRDAAVSFLRVALALRGIAFQARKSGKIKTGCKAASLFVIVLLMLLSSRGMMSIENVSKVSAYVTYFVALVSVMSGIEYMVFARKYIRDLFITK